MINMKDWSNLAKIIYKRTYSRINETGKSETWEQTVDRVIEGNIGKYRGTPFLEPNEEERLRYFLLNRKASPAGRGLWFSGTTAQEKLGGMGLNNCAYFSLEDIYTLVDVQDYLMLGSGVGVSVEHRFVSKLPKVRKDVEIIHKPTKDADFIIPDSREGWNKLTSKLLKAFFYTGKGFTFSTVCVRGSGEPIKGFGGTASGPIPLIEYVEKVVAILKEREGKHLRPVDCLDIVCCIGEMVVSGNVRRSAIIILGDPWDKEYLKAKRWELGNIPNYRDKANLSVVCDDIEDLHPLFWKTYENGEPFGLVNRTNMQKYGRMGEKKKDNAVGVNPCGEVPLESGEICNLQEIYLPNLSSIEEFREAARLMHRWGKRVSNEDYHNDLTDKIVKKNRRIGTGITGCLQSGLFAPEVLDEVYNIIQKENVEYSKKLGIPESIRTTTVKPSGTLSKLGECTAGIHPAFSRYYIQRVRFSSNDPIVQLLKNTGHKIEFVERFDGTYDRNTVVAEFYVETPEGTQCADENFDTWKQLEVLKTAQKHWSDNSVSVTVYYKREELDTVKQWLKDNLKEIKCISFLCHSEHGFAQAPWEAISKEEYQKLSAKVQPVNFEDIVVGDLESMECEGGSCPLK